MSFVLCVKEVVFQNDWPFCLLVGGVVMIVRLLSSLLIRVSLTCKAGYRLSINIVFERRSTVSGSVCICVKKCPRLAKM